MHKYKIGPIRYTVCMSGAKRSLYILLSMLWILSVIACGRETEKELVIFAASSLTDVFQELGEEYQLENPRVSVQFNFAGSSNLRMQLEYGAKADLYASANSFQIDLALKNNAVRGLPKQFASNELVLVTPKGNTKVNSLKDLPNQDVKIIFGASVVPIGVYSNIVLDKLAAAPVFGVEYRKGVEKNIVSYEPNVRMILNKIVLKQADAAFVYFTDINSVDPDLISIIRIPDKYNASVGYFILETSNVAKPIDAKKFVRFIGSEKGLSILKSYGFQESGQ